MKRLTKIFKTLLGVAIITLAVIAANLFYEFKYGRDFYDRRLSDNISLHSFSDNKWRVYDKQTGEYTTDKINWLSEVPENDSLAVYALPNKRGYINVNTGRIIINAEANDYRKAWVFSEGLAAVMSEGKIGFVNPQNEVVIPFQFDYMDGGRVCNLGYAFHNGNCAMTDADGNWGLINRCGNWIVEPIYDEVWAPQNGGCRVIVKDGKYGVLNSECSIVYPVEYDYVKVVSDGFILTQEGKKWQVDFEGNIVQPFMYDNTYYLNYPIDYNDFGEIQYAFADFVKYEVMNCYGIMNRITGEPVTPAIYSDVKMLFDGLFEVQTRDKCEKYLLDTNGKMVSKK